MRISFPVFVPRAPRTMLNFSRLAINSRINHEGNNYVMRNANVLRSVPTDGRHVANTLIRTACRLLTFDRPEELE